MKRLRRNSLPVRDIGATGTTPASANWRIAQITNPSDPFDLKGS